MVPDARPVDVRTYYDRPVLKEPTWKWFIPAYFFAGGLAAGSSMLAAGFSATRDHAAARRARLVALPAIGAGSMLLVADLGRPERFHHMLRVAKPSSPMSTGTWILALYAPAAAVAAITDVVDRLPLVRGAATWFAALGAPLVATYTAVLVADTAVPVWHDARQILPTVFASSATAAAAGAAILTSPQPPPAARRLAVGAALIESTAAFAMERRLGAHVRTAYGSGPARRLSLGARLSSISGAIAIAISRRRPFLERLGASLILAGSLCERFAVTEAGKASARDPRATVGPQRGGPRA